MQPCIQPPMMVLPPELVFWGTTTLVVIVKNRWAKPSSLTFTWGHSRIYHIENSTQCHMRWQAVKFKGSLSDELAPLLSVAMD